LTDILKVSCFLFTQQTEFPLFYNETTKPCTNYWFSAAYIFCLFSIWN